MAQNIENSISCSSANDELFITGSFRVSKHWMENQKETKSRHFKVLNIKASHELFFKGS